MDHFAAKSRAELGLAYEWSNYRLACLGPNRSKREFHDVIDPFLVKPGMFQLEPVTGHIFSNPELSHDDRKQVDDTIKRLDLDGAGCRRMRQRHYDEFRRYNLPPKYLTEKYPFLFQELVRQGLLEVI